MKFNPNEEQQEKRTFEPFPAGEYTYTIEEAEETTSKAGNPMIHAVLFVYNDEGHKRIVHEYIVDTATWKLKQVAASCGLLAAYERGEIEAHEFVGKTGRCKLVVESSEGYEPKNRVQAYLPVAGSAPAPSTRGKVQAGPDLDDSIPFIPCWQ